MMRYAREVAEMSGQRVTVQRKSDGAIVGYIDDDGFHRWEDPDID